MRLVAKQNVETDGPFWFGGRNGYWAYEDEWRSSPSWSLYTYVMDRVRWDTNPMQLSLAISGKVSGGRVRPHRWSSYLELGRRKEKLEEGFCKSVKDAQRRALSSLSRQDVIDFAAKAYGDHSRAECISVLDETGTPKPFCTMLDIFYGGYMFLPNGEYFVARKDTYPESQMKFYSISRFWHGYAGGGKKVEKAPYWIAE